MNNTEENKEYLFTVWDLHHTYGFHPNTINKMIAGSPFVKIGRSKRYRLRDITTLIEPIPVKLAGITPVKLPEKDPLKMTSINQVNYYRAECLKESSRSKKIKNRIGEGELLVAQQVERTTAEAFKKIALVLDTLPDALERDGIISNSNITKTINVIDQAREKLAEGLNTINNG